MGVKRNPRVLALTLGLYGLTEVICLLFGFGILPVTARMIGVLSGATLSGLLWGPLIEMQIVRQVGQTNYKPFLVGIVYVVPPTEAFAARISAVSLVCYTALMARVTWCLVARARRPSESGDG